MANSNGDFRILSNSRISSRFRQFVVLVVVISVGMIISIIMNH